MLKNAFLLIVLVGVALLLFSCKQSNSNAYNIPKLNQYSDTLEYITAVRNYVAQHANIGFYPNTLCDTYSKIPLNKFKEDSFFFVFQRKTGVTSCGLSSHIMAKLLTDEGVNACVYGYGILETEYMHSVCLVQYNTKWIFCDPYFNYMFVDEHKNPIDFFALLEIIKTEKYDRAQISTDTVLCNMLIDTKSITQEVVEHIPKECKGIYENYKRNGIAGIPFKAQEPIYFNYKLLGCRDFMGGLENALMARGRNGDFREAILFKSKSIISFKDFSALDESIDSALLR